MTDIVERVAMHLDRCLCTYVDGDDTRATDLTSVELRDIARAIIPMVEADMRERCATVADERWEYGLPPEKTGEAIRNLPIGDERC